MRRFILDFGLEDFAGKVTRSVSEGFGRSSVESPSLTLWVT